MTRLVTAIALAIAMSSPALSQGAPPGIVSPSELAERSAEMSFLSEACGNPRYKFSMEWLREVGDPRFADEIARKFEALQNSRPRPNPMQACSELLYKYGPFGIVERGWIEERAH